MTSFDSFILPDLPYPISENRMYITVRTPKGVPYRTLSQEGRTWQNAVSEILNSQGTGLQARQFIDRSDGEIELWLFLFRNNWYTRSGDVSKSAGDPANYIKLLQDTIMTTIGIDDSCIRWGHQGKCDTDGTPYCRVALVYDPDVSHYRDILS